MDRSSIKHRFLIANFHNLHFAWKPIAYKVNVGSNVAKLGCFATHLWVKYEQTQPWVILAWFVHLNQHNGLIYGSSFVQ